jgi:hypothetical protein
MGGLGLVVEVEETFVGVRDSHRNRKNKRGSGHKHVVLSLVEHGVDNATTKNHRSDRSLQHRARVVTHDRWCWSIYSHARVVLEPRDSEPREEEYIRGNVHTNTIEGFFSIFKRGKGVY